MTFRQDIKKIFDELEETDIAILGVMAMEGSELIPYDIWKQVKEIPQRTVYDKVKRLAEAKYVTKIGEQRFKRKLSRKPHCLTLKGMLASLAYEKLSFDRLADRFRTELHIPERYAKAVKPLISIWAYFESRVSRLERHIIGAESIFKVVFEMRPAWKDVGPEPHSILSAKFELPSVDKFREELGITEEEYRALDNFVSVMVSLRLPEKMELEKRVLSYSSGLGPLPWLADCIEIPPYFAIRMFWSASDYKARTDTSNFLSWFSMHKNIASLISRGDIIRLDQYLRESVSKLQFSWRPVCLKREYDGMCALKNTKCPHDSLLECELVREDARKFEGLLNFIIERWAKF